MLTILYSPHMTSVDNETKRASGHADVPLSEAGLRQAHELGQQYADFPLVAVFCSDLDRARTTAEIAFADRGLPIIPDARLREYDYGNLTQHPVAEVEAQFPRRIDEPFPNGESLRRVVARVGDFLREILPEYDGKTVALIDHRATRYALEYWCGDQSLEAIITAQWEWRDIPIWRYEIDAAMLERRAIRELEQSIGKPIPSLTHIQADKIGFCVENDRVIALSLRGCDLTTLPDSLWQLTDLQTLILGENPLISLSERISELKLLRQLYIYNTELTSLPETIGQLTNLRILDLGHNKLTSISDSLGSLSELTTLYLHDNQLTALPDALFEHLDKLTYLNVGDNRLTSLPESIGKLTHLRDLRADNAQLTSLPDSLANLTHLRELHARSNWLDQLPESLGKLTNLRRLYLHKSWVTALPESIGNLTNLTELDLRDNKLTALPESIGKLQSLVYLDLRANPLTALPESIGDLPKLEKLDLRWTRITPIPDGFERLEARGCQVYL